MKNKICATAAIFLIVVTMLSAKDSVPKPKLSDKQIARALTNVLVGLHSHNDGLIESAIVVLAKIKMKYPEVVITQIQAVVDSISITHPSGILRYKAHLSSSICNDPVWFVQESSIVTEDHEKFFMLAAQRLQQKIYGLSAL